jgi:aminoglycoside phosphotransferase (APT) family kinase protein
MDAVWDRVRAALGPLDGDPVPLGGGITNHNYRWGEYVVRIPGANTNVLGIDRSCEAAATRLGHQLGLGPELISDDPFVTRFVEGRTLDAEGLRERADDVRGMLAVLHSSGAELPGRFDAVEVVQGYARLAPPPAEHAARIAALEAEPYVPVPCHNDLLAANVVEREDGRLALLDWEYAGMGDPRFDLANLAMNAGLECDDAHAFELSLLREAMWGVVQAAHSDLDHDFEGYADEHFARLA